MRIAVGGIHTECSTYSSVFAHIDPTKTRLLVVESGYLSPELAPLAKPNLMVLTDGVVNQDIPRLSNTRRPAGTVPFDISTEFTPIPKTSARFTG